MLMVNETFNTSVEAPKGEFGVFLVRTAVTERAAAKPIESREQASTGGELAYSDLGFDFATQLQKTEVYFAAAQRVRSSMILWVSGGEGYIMSKGVLEDLSKVLNPLSLPDW
ncbi:hypothetical protein Ddye_020463 [Dipteronia dyeriana]|uniref:Uncharacterized protein n=1 Tax=Dipteronia dyeriana TaxID=168575 RepID=A0AAD9U086_9ROSI|nr:hypothetical protein Ddye_020463 [Dipteronia dyeriana]